MADKLGTLIREGRTEKGWTQAQLAAKVKGLSASDIGRIERGEKVPETEQIKLIAKALGVTQTSLLNAAKGKTSAGKSGSSKTGSGKTGSGKTTSGKAGSGKTASSAGTSVKVTAAEKKLLSRYRKADDMTKEAVDRLLEAAAPSSSQSSAAGDLIQSLLGNVLEQMIGKK